MHRYLLITYFTFNISIFLSAANLFQKLTTENSSCPRYACQRREGDNDGGGGFGDQLFHTYGMLAITYLGQYTACHPYDYSKKSSHGEPSQSLFELLGIPIESFVKRKALNDKNFRVQRFDIENLLVNPKILEDLPCHSIVEVDMNCGKFGLCQTTMSNVLFNNLGPVFHQMRLNRIANGPPKYEFKNLVDNREEHRNTPVKLHFDGSAINVVWHYRNGDLCLFCRNVVYFDRIHKFIKEAIGHTKHRNIILSPYDDERGPNDPKKAFKNLPHTQYVYVTLSATLQIMMQADILVTTGSSLPTSVIWSTDLYRPLVFEGEIKEIGWQNFHHFSKYNIPEERAIRVLPANDGSIYLYNVADIKHILELTGVFERVQKATQLRGGGATNVKDNASGTNRTTTGASVNNTRTRY